MTDIRIGLGTDLHRLGEGLPLFIGGVFVPHYKGCIGHSDGDALIHAVCDALLGAAGMRDIGYHFPDTSDENKGRKSSEFLLGVVQMLKEAGYKIVNIDCTVHLQKPKLRDLIPGIVANMSRLMQVEEGRFSLKAKTGEGIGAVGNEEAIEVVCTALIEKIS
jgi:2-C-methyl-D-erythritol 2,4-cyclodiphosphate synthase